MEADWEFEIGTGAPVIDACWDGLIDLRAHPSRAASLPECAAFPALAAALLRFNSAASPVWTSKCDVWPEQEPAAFDPDEFDAPAGAPAYAEHCYIDLLPRDAEAWRTPTKAEAACRSLCDKLHEIPLHSCRADLIVRRAVIGAAGDDLGITAYLTGCGVSAAAARTAMAAALAAFADVICFCVPLQ